MKCIIEECINKVYRRNMCSKHILQEKRGTLNDGRFNKKNVLYVGEDIHNHTVKPITYKEDYFGCWIITSHAKDKDGYGAVVRNIEGLRYIKAHRISYAYYNGELGTDDIVRHTCNNPSCINPNHLVKGSHKDNMSDRMRSGNYHLHNGNNIVLSEKDVLNIDKMIIDGFSISDISSITGFNRSTIYDIARGKTWTNITNRKKYKPKK